MQRSSRKKSRMLQQLAARQLMQGRWQPPLRARNRRRWWSNCCSQMQTLRPRPSPPLGAQLAAALHQPRRRHKSPGSQQVGRRRGKAPSCCQLALPARSRRAQHLVQSKEALLHSGVACALPAKGLSRRAPRPFNILIDGQPHKFRRPFTAGNPEPPLTQCCLRIAVVV